MLQFDTTISVGDIVAVTGMVGLVAVYFLDTRYSPKGAHADIRAIRKTLEQLECEFRQHLDDDIKRFDETRISFGETVAAIRTKLTDVEIFTRDTFVRRDSFQQALSANQILLTGMITDLKAWMSRMEARLNRVLDSKENSG